jgi:hypothetical protein
MKRLYKWIEKISYATAVPTGVGEQGTFIVGFSRNLGDLVVSVEVPGYGNPVNNSLAHGRCALRPRERTQGAAAVPCSEGNEATREGRQEVGVL